MIFFRMVFKIQGIKILVNSYHETWEKTKFFAIIKFGGKTQNSLPYIGTFWTVLSIIFKKEHHQKCVSCLTIQPIIPTCNMVKD